MKKLVVFRFDWHYQLYKEFCAFHGRVVPVRGITSYMWESQTNKLGMMDVAEGARMFSNKLGTLTALELAWLRAGRMDMGAKWSYSEEAGCWKVLEGSDSVVSTVICESDMQLIEMLEAYESFRAPIKEFWQTTNSYRAPPTGTIAAKKQKFRGPIDFNSVAEQAKLRDMSKMFEGLHGAVMAAVSRSSNTAQVYSAERNGFSHQTRHSAFVNGKVVAAFICTTTRRWNVRRQADAFPRLPFSVRLKLWMRDVSNNDRLEEHFGICKAIFLASPTCAEMSIAEKQSIAKQFLKIDAYIQRLHQIHHGDSVLMKKSFYAAFDTKVARVANMRTLQYHDKAQHIALQQPKWNVEKYDREKDDEQAAEAARHGEIEIVIDLDQPQKKMRRQSNLSVNPNPERLGVGVAAIVPIQKRPASV